ncbi:Protein Ric1 [Trichinella patagoniensis]|uniref:Protein Ric1 n=3 Tax=Trichinella TaxID=6333 RepID=A0A0V0ZB43_9BILA|nr:Protein Ric1 [Trichinella murrelli]KRY09581.1 Protein Ric1 [Trichinella patagoniensis]KRY39190.1 Protein Ric1 [Trichinella spiralis]KRZ92146.1 Protein Ric1 [Trichinella sp. T8]
MALTIGDCPRVCCALLLPPVAVAMQTGCFTTDVAINILLTLLGFIPGVIHAFYVILRD